MSSDSAIFEMFASLERDHMVLVVFLAPALTGVPQDRSDSQVDEISLFDPFPFSIDTIKRDFFFCAKPRTSFSFEEKRKKRPK